MKNKDYYQQPPAVVADKRFQTCVQYANFISQFFEEHGVANWELAGIKTRFPIDEKFCGEADKINPDHYKVGGIEAFDILKAKLSPEELIGHCKANVLTYIMRASHKGGAEDCQKAKWYMDKLVELVDGKTSS